MSHLNAAIPAVGHRLIQGVEEIQRVKGDPYHPVTTAELTTHKDIYDFLKSPSGIVQSRQTETEAKKRHDQQGTDGVEDRSADVEAS